MKHGSWVLILGLLWGVGCQKKHHTPYEKAADAVGDSEFFEREQVARSLLVYDTLTLIARAEASSSDAICLPSEAGWICVTGSWDGLGQPASELTGWAMGDPVSPAAAVPSAVAPLATARALAAADLAEPTHWRLLPRETPDGVEVWGIAIGQEDDQAWVGGTRRWVVDAGSGAWIARDVWDREHWSTPLDPAVEAWIPSDEPRHPRVSELFFALYHHADLGAVGIETQTYRVGLENLDGTLGWSRALRE